MFPDNNQEYLQPGYWDDRFQQEAAYDWFKPYSSFAHLVRPHLRSQDSVLVLGCGNSSLTADLYHDGFTHITSTDLSSVVIERMRQRAEADGLAGVTWQVADMLDLPFPDGFFDVVVEKGTLDVLLVDSGSPWDPAPQARQRVARMLDETHRVL